MGRAGTDAAATSPPHAARSGPIRLTAPSGSSAQAELRELCEAARTRQLLVLVSGRPIVEHYWQADTPDSTVDVASLQKSVVGLLLFCLLEEGRIALDDPVCHWLGAGWTHAPAIDEEQLLIGHLATMTSGLANDLTVTAAPGTVWHYNTNAYHQLRRALEVAGGAGIDALFSRLLSGPLHLGSSGWRARAGMIDPLGRPLMALHTGARDLARIGLFLLRRRTNASDTVLPPKRYDQMLTASTLNPSYANLWWLPTAPWGIRPGGGGSNSGAGDRRVDHPLIPTAPPGLVAAMGAGGHRLYVSADHDLVAVRLGSGPPGADAADFDEQFWTRLSHLLGLPPDEPARARLAP